MSLSRTVDPRAKMRSVALIAAAQVAALATWFASVAILPDLAARHTLSPWLQAAFQSAVQLGFVAGTLASALLGLADRLEPRRLFAASASVAGLSTLGLLAVAPDGIAPVLLRALTGAALAGVYPVGLKLATGWGMKDRGFLTGLLVGALTLGSASPHLAAAAGFADWRVVVAIAGGGAFAGAGLILLAECGPYHRPGGRFRPGVAWLAWSDRRLRLINLGYLGHMWELYAMWAWIGAIVAASGMAMGPRAISLLAFAVIGIGVLGCIGGGLLADRIGRAEVTIGAMALSGTSALAAALLLDAPAFLLVPVLLVWGVGVIADSAQFSALIADHAPDGTAGTLLTMQTCQGFLLTFLVVQAAPLLADAVGWRPVVALLALGPLAGILAMRRAARL